MAKARVAKKVPTQKARKKKKLSGQTIGSRSSIAAWEDDPMSSGAKLVAVQLPQRISPPFAVQINGDRPEPKAYKPKSAGFRYWNAFDALERSATFWRTILQRAVPTAKDWYCGSPLHVDLDRGSDLNAYYDRKQLSFFHATVAGKVVYSGESPDVLSHELGHAVLDSIHPKLWDAASDEIAAFHESFADISSICAALQLKSLREAAIAETGANFYGSSRVSRLAEQLGWAIRQVRKDASESDCLRNAVNSFCYHPPQTLPHEAPSTMLSSESHSFSRVFTAGFFGMLCNMFHRKRNGGRDADQLLEVANDAATLLVKGVDAASVAPNFYREVALGMLRADQELFGGNYADSIRAAFVRRGVLPLQVPSIGFDRKEPIRQSMLPRVSRRVGAAGGIGATAIQTEEDVELQAAAGDAGLRRVTFRGEELGLDFESLSVYAASDVEYQRGAVPIETGAQDEAVKNEARMFVENLLRLNKVDLDPKATTVAKLAHPMVATSHLLNRATHVLSQDGDNVVLMRRLFE